MKRNQMVSSTDLSRRFRDYLDRTSIGLERLFVTRNNQIEAVLLGIEDYERLAQLEELVEHLEIARLIADRSSESETDLDTLLAEEGLSLDELRQVEVD